MDENKFFREIAIRICGSLEIEKALWSSLLYLRKIMPVDILDLAIYDLESGTNSILAGARDTGGAILNVEVKQPPEAQALLETWYRNPDRHAHVRIVDDAMNDQVLGPALNEIESSDLSAEHKLSYGLNGKLKGISVLHLRLTLEGKALGALIVINMSGNQYTQKHARLIALLNEPFTIALSNYLRYLEVVKLKDLLADDNRYLRSELRRASGEEIVGADFGLRGVMEQVRQVTPLDSPILLRGETGTGKEVIATAIHNQSLRKDGPLIKVNCGAIPESLMDSELFGHEKGAFTGAISQKKGRFERADKGTIFLDEIGELTPVAQVRLLRVLQDKKIERLGGVESIKVNIRIIAATHRDLEDMVRNNLFREDLYFRLNVFPIVIPPLRERSADIPALVHYFIQKKTQELGLAELPSLAPDAMISLLSYSWPGNVRELENAVERSLILRKGGQLTFADLVFPDEKGEAESEYREYKTGKSLELDKVVSKHITKVLNITKGKVHGSSGAAALLNVNPSTLRKRMRKLGIPFGQKWKKGG